MKNIINYDKSIFDSIKHIDENGNEYWLARELMPLFEYRKWERFTNAINNAKIACENSGYNVNEHFPGVGKMISLGKGGKRRVDNEYTASSIHYEMGKKVRKAIKDMRGTMPEELPTPNKSLKEIEKDNKNSIK